LRPNLIPRAIENCFQISNIRDMEPTLEQMARSLVESGDYRVTGRLEPQAEYHSPDDIPKFVAAVVDVETTGINPESDKIIELSICLFEYDRESGRIYKVLGSWEWFEDPGFSIPPEITNITGITDEMVAGQRIDDRAVNDLLSRVVLVIATMRISIVASWNDGSQSLSRNTGRAAVSISTGRRVSVHRRLNSSPIHSDSSMTGIEPRAIVGPLSMRWRNRSPAQGGWHCRLSWNRRDCRHGGYGRGTPPSRRRMFSRPAVTPGAPESSGDRNAGIAMCRTRIRRQRCRGSAQT
jgi:Exonuclease